MWAAGAQASARICVTSMKAVILAGGLGNRLKPFTDIIPKPLLPVGESSVLEVAIRCLRNHGATDIFIATYYRADYIRSFLGDGSNYDVRLHYSTEPKPLGTCGPLTLLKDELTEPFVVMNGDILTTLDFGALYEFALGKEADLTVVTKEITTPCNFGEVTAEGEYILDVEEKPDFRFEIVAGIYVLKPTLFELIPEDTYYGIDSLIKEMLRARRPVARYLTTAYWLDIGQVDDYQVAQEAYGRHFNNLESGNPNGNSRSLAANGS